MSIQRQATVGSCIPATWGGWLRAVTFSSGHPDLSEWHQHLGYHPFLSCCPGGAQTAPLFLALGKADWPGNLTQDMEREGKCPGPSPLGPHSRVVPSLPGVGGAFPQVVSATVCPFPQDQCVHITQWALYKALRLGLWIPRDAMG